VQVVSQAASQKTDAQSQHVLLKEVWRAGLRRHLHQLGHFVQPVFCHVFGQDHQVVCAHAEYYQVIQ